MDILRGRELQPRRVPKMGFCESINLPLFSVHIFSTTALETWGVGDLVPAEQILGICEGCSCIPNRSIGLVNKISICTTHVQLVSPVNQRWWRSRCWSPCPDIFLNITKCGDQTAGSRDPPMTDVDDGSDDALHEPPFHHLHRSHEKASHKHRKIVVS